MCVCVCVRVCVCMCMCVCVLPGISVSAVPSSTVLAAGQCVYGQHVEGVSSTHEKCVLQMRLQLLGVGIARNLLYVVIMCHTTSLPN